MSNRPFSIISRYIGLACLAIVVILFFQNCGVEQPRVEFPASAMTPAAHQTLSADTKCATCHEGTRPLVRTLSHNFSHSSSTFIAQDCITCHTDKQTWGATWVGGQYAHDPYPGACLECHTNQMPKSNIFISNNTAQPYLHTAGVECATCHTNTSQFNTLANWRPALAEPTGLVGSKSFTIQTIIPSFTGSIMTRPPAISNILKLEIDHSDVQVSALACVTCHSNSTTTGSFAGALFHKNILADPASCVQCHTNARPTGAVGAKQIMRHEAVAWVSNSIGSVNRGTASMVLAECTSCHLNAPSMPLAGTNPIPNSKPFSGANFHANTTANSLASCLDCHAYSRPAGSANFTDATWRNKTNVGGPPFTTFDLARHAPNIDCATCHTAPSVANTTVANWANGNFIHSNANLNCLNCHTAGGITSTNHTGFNSNCISCHTGAATQFPNPVIGSWKLGVTGGTLPTGVVGDKLITNAVTCTGVLGRVPNCVPASPNLIVKGMDHTVNTNAVSCQNCHGTGSATAANGKFHTRPTGAATWTAPAAADIANCIKCHDPAAGPLNVATIRNIGTVGSLANLNTGAAPFAGVHHGVALIAGQQCTTCHSAPTAAAATTWNSATKIHATFTQTQIATCTECHYQRMPAGNLPRKIQLVYKGTHVPQQFTHTSLVSMPTVALQQCATCHTDDGVSWSTPGKNTFHNKVSVTSSCNTCHIAPQGPVTSTTTGITFNHSTVANIGDCATCHQATITRVTNRLPTAIDWDGGTAAPANYTIPNHTTGGITVPGYTGVHSSSTNCVSCHGTNNYKVITDFDHQGLPAGQNSCVSCHLGSKADVAAFIAPTSGIIMKTVDSRHHPTASFNGTSLSCVGCHTRTPGAATFTNTNGIVYPSAARAAYVAVGCGTVNNATFSCHQASQQTMTVPTTTGTTGRWR